MAFIVEFSRLLARKQLPDGSEDETLQRIVGDLDHGPYAELEDASHERAGVTAYLVRSETELPLADLLYLVAKGDSQGLFADFGRGTAEGAANDRYGYAAALELTAGAADLDCPDYLGVTDVQVDEDTTRTRKLGELFQPRTVDGTLYVLSSRPLGESQYPSTASAYVPGGVLWQLHQIDGVTAMAAYAVPTEE